MKYNADGTILEWKKCFNNAYMFLFPAPDGNFIVGGYRTTPANANDYYISKIDALGNEIWIKYYGGSSEEELHDMTATDDGGYFMFGDSYSNDGDVNTHYGSLFSADLWVIKLDSSGNKIWSSVIGGANDEYPQAIVQVPDGGCYIEGWTQSWDYDCTGYHGAGDAYVARLDNNGHIIWHHCLGGTASDGSGGWAIADGKGGVIVATGSYSTDGDVHNHFGDEDIWVVNLDSNNNILWEKSYGGSNNDATGAITKSVDGSIWIAGGTQSVDGQVAVNYGSSDAWIIHADSTGNILSAKVIGESQDDGAVVIQCLMGGMVLVGGTYDAPGVIGGEFPSDYWGATDIFLARLAPWTTEVKNISNAAAWVNIYPNPASENVYINSSCPGGYKIKVLDVWGRNVYVGEADKGIAVDVRNYAKGIYYVQISGNGAQVTTKLIVQ